MAFVHGDSVMVDSALPCVVDLSVDQVGCDGAAVGAGGSLVGDTFGNVSANVAVENPSHTLPSTSVFPQGMPMSPYVSQDGQIVTAPTYHNPIRSVPYSAIPPNQATRPAATVTAPNFNLVPAARVNSTANNSVVNAQVPQTNSSAIDENMATLRSELQKMFYDNFGI
jgi:hypothetical protein